MPQRGCASRNSTCFSSFSGCHMSSASRYAISSPEATESALLRAADTPAFGCLRNVIRDPYDSRTRGVSSLEPSSTTMISLSVYVCASALSIAAPTYLAALYAGMIVETLGTMCSPPPAASRFPGLRHDAPNDQIGRASCRERVRQ